ncbi:unnamed protein product [Urochloa humidicola]
MALKFLNKKGWHTGSLRNIERVWKAEQAEEAEKRKTEELKKQVAAEKEKAEFRAMQERAGLRPAQERLDFLYESGLAVGKSSEGFQALQQSAPGTAGASSSSAPASAADSSKAKAPGALFEDKPQSANDTWRKLHSDPLLLIRQREQDAIARIKNNPIKMAEIKKSVDAEKKQKEEKKEKKRHKKHRHHKSKSKRHHSDENSDSDEISDGKDERRKRVHSSPDHKKEEKRSRHAKKHRRQDSSDSDNDEPRRRQDASEDDEPKRRRRDDNEPRRRRHDDDEPRRRRQGDDEERRGRRQDVEEQRGRRQDGEEQRGRRQDNGEQRGRRHDGRPRFDRLDTDERKRRQHSPPDRHHGYSKYDGPDSGYKRVENGHKSGNSTSEHRARTEQDLGEQTRQESEHGRNNGPPFNRRRGGVHHMSEEDRLARLHQMQADAEVHESQRWKRLKKAADDDAKEAATVTTSQFKGKNFLEDEKKSIFGTEKGGSATIEESIRRRAFYSQGGRDAEGNAFRR